MDERSKKQLFFVGMLQLQKKKDDHNIIVSIVVVKTDLAANNFLVVETYNGLKKALGLVLGKESKVEQKNCQLKSHDKNNI